MRSFDKRKRSSKKSLPLIRNERETMKRPLITTIRNHCLAFQVDFLHFKRNLHSDKLVLRKQIFRIYQNARWNIFFSFRISKTCISKDLSQITLFAKVNWACFCLSQLVIHKQPDILTYFRWKKINKIPGKMYTQLFLQIKDYSIPLSLCNQRYFLIYFQKAAIASRIASQQFYTQEINTNSRFVDDLYTTYGNISVGKRRLFVQKKNK